MPKAIEQAPFGKVGDQEVSLYTLRNTNGLILKVTNYGTIVTEFHVPDRDGKFADVVLGFENIEGYLAGNPYFGATAGRVANRIANAKFKLDNKWYKLAANNKPHHLHGGEKGFDKVVWSAETQETAEGPSILFRYLSKDGEEGYPGNLNARVTYTLTNSNEFRVEMSATSDAPTIVNLAHHSYWNLGGFNSGPITEHELTINADEYTPGAPPQGSVRKVKGTPFDFTAPKVIGKDLKAAGGTPIGFDHNWIVRGDANQMRQVAKLKDPKSGRVMTIEADQPGVQFYSGNYLDGKTTGKGVAYAQYTGLCLETQKYPNAINLPAWQNQVILRPDGEYKHKMVHRFSVE
jgi:aldose 1-epimerase